jgi:hypothetical protein
MHNTLNLILVIISTFLFFNPVHAAFFMGLGDLQNEIIYSGATGVYQIHSIDNQRAISRVFPGGVPVFTSSF